MDLSPHGCGPALEIPIPSQRMIADVPSNSLRILIVGGGVAGGLVAGWLKDQPGVAVRAVERVSADDHTNAGNGLNIGPNGLRLLGAVWPEKYGELAAASLPWAQWLVRRVDGSVGYYIPLNEVSSQPGIRIRWSELYRISRSSALPVLAFDTLVETAEPVDAGMRLRVVERDLLGAALRRDDYDLVIVTEGRYAKLREAFATPPDPRHLGIANFRTLLDDGGRVPLDDMEQWMNGPVRLIATRLHDGLIFISGNLPIEPGASVSEEMKDKEYLRRAYIPDTGQVDSRLSELVAGFCAPDSVHHWARAQEIETRWSDADGRLFYLGDAAHAMVPTLGQGATQAIEDAAAFIKLFQHWRAAGGDASTINRLAPAFSHLRTERVDFVKEFSAEASDLLLLGSDTEACLERKRGPDFHRKLIRLYEEIPLEDTPYLAALEAVQHLTS